MGLVIPVKERIYRELDKHFDKDVDIRSRVSIFADVEKFRWKDDESVWAQKREKAPQVFSIYFDYEFVCYFDTSHDIKLFMLSFWKGLKELYKSNRIRLNKREAQEDRLKREVEQIKKEKEEKKRIDNLDESTPTTKMAKELTKKLNSNAKRKKGKLSPSAT